jgi:cytochrome P450
LARWSGAITAMLPRPRFDTEEWHRIESYITELLSKREQLSEAPDDMITRLINARVGGRPLTVREITGHVWLLFVGGLENTAYALSTLVHQILAQRSQWERLLVDRALVPKAVEEALRYTSPLRAVERQVTSPAKVGECRVQRGQIIFVGLESANFDESIFGEDAHVFRVDRADSGRHMAFGLGRHTCLGAQLARSELTTALSCLLELLPGMRLAPGFTLETLPSQFSNIPKSIEVIW